MPKQIAAGNSRCHHQLRLIYEIVRHTFISASRSAAVPELFSSLVARRWRPLFRGSQSPAKAAWIFVRQHNLKKRSTNWSISSPP